MHPDPMNKRIVHIRRGDTWEITGLENVRRGDVFKMFEVDGTPLAFCPAFPGEYENLAVYDSFVNEQGRNEVESITLKEIFANGLTIEQELEMYPVTG